MYDMSVGPDPILPFHWSVLESFYFTLPRSRACRGGHRKGTESEKGGRGGGTFKHRPGLPEKAEGLEAELCIIMSNVPLMRS